MRSGKRHRRILIKKFKLLFFASFMVLLIPSSGRACACGCNVFTVGTQRTMPVQSGFEAFFQFNFMNQNADWRNWSSAPANLNPDLDILTQFYTLGLQYMVDREWGVMIEAPMWDRYYRTTLDDGSLASVSHNSFGDVRVTGMFTGLSEDMSTGIQFGLKLPTGPFDQSLMDRDTQIGTGTTDLLLGGYRMSQESEWGWSAQLIWQHALTVRSGYRPGDSFDVNGGIHYDGLLSSINVMPTLQIAVSMRGIDSGVAADPENTGYDRVFIAPGVEIPVSRKLNFYADVHIPVWTYVRGVQLVAPSLLGMTVSYGF
jgi:hypothetical protein